MIAKPKIADSGFWILDSRFQYPVLIYSVANLTLLYINSEAIIPAPYQARGKLQRESSRKHWIPPYHVHGRLSQARYDK